MGMHIVYYLVSI